RRGSIRSISTATSSTSGGRRSASCSVKPQRGSSVDSPDFPPRVAFVVADEGDASVYRKIHARFAPADEQREKARQVRKVSDDRDVARLAAQPIADPLRRVVGLQIARR